MWHETSNRVLACLELVRGIVYVFETVWLVVVVHTHATRGATQTIAVCVDSKRHRFCTAHKI